ncbi:MAG: biotin synthase BioB [Planctomycetes bacterium]|jgi:biotin synthase|nr:biotin synthase BioB [Planctomycetota bacterium]
MDWDAVASRVLGGGDLSWEEGLAALRGPFEELLPLLGAAFRVRAARSGRRVAVNVILNARSGTCSEDCEWCSQSARAESDVPRYPLKSAAEIVEGAARAAAAGAGTYCVVTSMRGPSAKDLATIGEAAREIKRRFPLRLCTSLGLLDDAAARTLAAAGVDRYNHNLETSRAFYPKLCTTHRYDDRVATIRAARAAGLSICSGGILGLGESDEDRVDLAFALRDLGVDALPVNLLDPRPGTALAERPRPTPEEALRGLAMFRLAVPRASEIRIAGGREACLGAMQPLALFAADSLFANGYLTTPGQGLDADLAMIRAAGFTPEIHPE